jgi:hypothetical protein
MAVWKILALEFETIDKVNTKAQASKIPNSSKEFEGRGDTSV